MGLGTSLILIAVGAVLRWAVSATVSGINLHVVGVILIIIGIVGFLISLYWMLTAGQRTGQMDPPDTRPTAGYTTPPQPRV